MAVTAGDLINRGLRILRIVDSDSTADATQLANGLLVLNGMIDSWNVPNAMLYEEQEEIFTLTGAASYTIGASGTFNTVQPNAILSAFYRSGTTDYSPLQVVTKQQWDVIPGKDTDTGFPNMIWYDEAYPLAIINLWPNPASGKLVLSSLKQLTEFAATSTTVSLPPAYRDAITYNFAVRYSPEGGVLTPETKQLAAETLAAVKRSNRKLVEAFLGCPGLTRARGNIYSG